MPNGGTLTVDACKESDDTVITVADTGIGIPEEVKAKMFTPMLTTKSKGQGFGLPVVKRMVEALNGNSNISKAKQAKAPNLRYVSLLQKINGK